MLDDRGKRDVERLGQPRNRNWAVAQLLDHRPASGIAQGMKDAIDLTLLTKHGSLYSSVLAR
jgi:hypothetical protein